MAESESLAAMPPPSAVMKLKEEAAAGNGDQSRVAMERTVSMDIRDEREDLKRAAEQSLNVLMDLGLDGNIRWVSPSWQDVVGTPADSVIGTPIADLIVDNKAAFSDTVESMKQDDSRSQIIHFSLKLGPASVLRLSTTDNDDSPETPKPKDNDEENQEEETTGSNSGDAEPVVNLEAQGIIVYNRTSGATSHTMWMIRPAVVREIKIDLPELLVESLGVGAEVLARHLTTLAEAGANDPSRHPPPMPILCRICERNITPWWFEKHSELCLQEHRAEMDVQFAHESLAEQRSIIVKILDTLESQTRQPRPSSGEIIQPPIATPEYKGLLIGPSSTPSSGPSSGRASPASPPSRSRDRSSSSFGHNRTRSFAIRRPVTRVVELVLDLCDTTIEISTPAIKDTRGENGSELRTQSPQSENRISQVLQWQSPNTVTIENEQGLSLLCEDSLSLAKAKVDAVFRYRGILEYSERIRVEFDVLVQECIDKAMRKAARVAAGDLSDSSEETSESESVRVVEEDPNPLPPPSLTPARSPAEESFFAGSFEGTSALATALRNSSDPTLNLSSFRRSSSAAGSSRSSSPRGSKTPRSTAMSSVFQRRSIHAESDTGAESDAGSVISSAMSASRRADSPGSEHGSLRRATSTRETDRKRRSLTLHQAMSNSRQESPARSQLSSSPLRVSKPRIPSGSESLPSPITSPALGTSEFSSPVMTAQHVHHHRRQSSATSSDVHRPASPRLTTTHPQPRAVPVSIKDFEIIKPISKGAFGSVYLSKKKSTGEYYAIKVLKKADMVAKNQVTNVKAERAIMMWQGESDFVAKLYWTFSSKDYLYLVMEYLNGGDCASLIKILGGLPEDWAKKYVAEVVLGVEHLHSRNIVHRDLKPDNLLIDQKGHLKLTDFGLSRMGLIGRQKRLLNSKSQEPVPDLLKSGPFQRNMSIASSRSASFDLQGTQSPNNTPDLTPAFTGDMSQPSYFSLNREESNSREHSRRTSGHRSDSGDTDALAAFFRRFSLAEEPGRNRSPIEEETSQPEDAGSSDPYLLQPTISNHVPLQKENTTTPPLSSAMMPPPMALFDPQDSTRRFVGTPDYLAPETINGFGQDEVSDWWSLGCILFEIVYGYPPFHADTPDEVFQNILSRKIDWPEADDDEASEEAKDLMNRLICLNPTERLGANTKDEHASGGEEIRKHPWFNDVNWDTLRDDEASFVPAPGNPEDTEYFDARGATLQNFADEFEDQVTSPGVTPGADYSDRPHDAISRVRNQVNNSLKRTLMPLHIPPHVRDGRSRRLSEPMAADDFGNFQFKNLPVLEKANKDVIQKLRAEAMQAQSKTLSGSNSATSPAVASPSPSLESSPMLPMPLKRTLSANKGHNRPASPSVSSGANCSPSRQSQPSSPLLVSFGTGQGHERRKTSSGSSNLSQPNTQSLQPGSFFEVPRLSNNFKTTSTASSPIKMTKNAGPQSSVPERNLSIQRQGSGSQASSATSPRARSLTVGSQEDNISRETLPSHHKRRSQVLNDSPSSSDNEEQQRQKALLRVQRRRQSSRRLSHVALADGGPTFRPLDILICEDHPVSRLVMEKLLEKLRCRTISVTNGSEAMRYAMSEVKFDIIMMEFKLPQINGADVARMIRDTKNANNHTPIVAVTGYLKELQGPHYFDGMVEKPPTTAKLTDVLGKLCQWKPAPPGWSPAQASAGSYHIPSSLRHQESSSTKVGDSPTSSSSGYVHPTSSSYRGSSREDSISSSFFGETDSMTSNEVPLIVSRQPTEEWRDRDILPAFNGLGITEGSFPVPLQQPPVTSEPKEMGKESNPPSAVPPEIKPLALPQQGTTTSAPMAHLTHQLSAPPIMAHEAGTSPTRSGSPPKIIKKSSLAAEATTTAAAKSPRKQHSAEKIAAKRRSFERERHESAESGDDEDEILGDERVRARSPKRRTSPTVNTTSTVHPKRTTSIHSATGQAPRSSKLSTEMMRTNSQGSVISVEDAKQSVKNDVREGSRESQDRIVEDVVAEEIEDGTDTLALPVQELLPNPGMEERSAPHTPERVGEEAATHTITPPEIFPKQPGEKVVEVVDMDITPKPQHLQADPDPTPRASGSTSPSRFSRE